MLLGLSYKSWGLSSALGQGLSENMCPSLLNQSTKKLREFGLRLPNFNFTIKVCWKNRNYNIQDVETMSINGRTDEVVAYMFICVCVAYKHAHTHGILFGYKTEEALPFVTAQMDLEGISVSCSVVSDSVTPQTVARRRLCPRNSPGKNTAVGCHFLLQGIFLIQGLNPGLLHCRQILHRLSHWALC